MITPPSVPSFGGFGLGALAGSTLGLALIQFGRRFLPSPIWDDPAITTWMMIFFGAAGEAIHSTIKAGPEKAKRALELRKLQLEIEKLEREEAAGQQKRPEPGPERLPLEVLGTFEPPRPRPEQLEPGGEAVLVRRTPGED